MLAPLVGLHRYKTMEMTKIAQYARSLYDAHGNNAELEAAKKAKQCEVEGDNAGAETWQAVRRAINELRGAPES